MSSNARPCGREVEHAGEHRDYIEARLRFGSRA